MKVNWNRNLVSAGPIAGKINLPVHPPIVGKQVALGGIASDILGLPDKASVAEGIGYGVAGVGSFAGAFFFPPGIPIASGLVKAGLVVTGGYLIFAGTKQLVAVAKGRTDAQEKLEKWHGFLFTPSAPPSLPVAGQIISPAEGGEVKWGVRALKFLLGPDVGYVVMVANVRHVGLDRPSPHSDEVVHFAARSTIRAADAGHSWFFASDPEPLILAPGEQKAVAFRIPHPGIWYTQQNGLMGLEIATTADFHTPLEIANVNVWMA